MEVLDKFYTNVLPSYINSPVIVLSFLNIFLTTGEGGLFRFPNIYGNAFIVLNCTISNMFSSVGDGESSAKCGIAAGLAYPMLTEMLIVRRMLPRRTMWMVGAGVVSYHSTMLWWEKNRFEDALED